MSAVSIKFKPASTYTSRTLKAVGSSMVQPKTLVPNMRVETSRPEFPSLRVCVATPLLSLFFVGGRQSRRDPSALPRVTESDRALNAVVGSRADIMDRQDALIINDAHLKLDRGILHRAGDFRFAKLPRIDARKSFARLLQIEFLRARRPVSFHLHFPFPRDICSAAREQNTRQCEPDAQKFHNNLHDTLYRGPISGEVHSRRCSTIWIVFRRA